MTDSSLEYKNAEKPALGSQLPGWTISGPIPVSELRYSAACHTANDDDVKLADVVENGGIESYGTTMVADRRTKEDKIDEILNSTIQFNGDRYEVGFLCNGEQSVYRTTFRLH